MKYRLFKLFYFLILIASISSCNSFSDDTPQEFEESIKNMKGVWQLSKVSRNGIDISQSMDFQRFHLILKEDSTYTFENYLPFIVKKSGEWKVDNPQYPFHLTFKENGNSSSISSEIYYPIVEGKRQVSLSLSPGSKSNKYVYVFERISE